MDKQQAAKLVRALRKLADKYMDLARRVTDLEEQEWEEDRWFADLMRELDAILPDDQTAIVDPVQ